MSFFRSFYHNLSFFLPSVIFFISFRIPVASLMSRERTGERHTQCDSVHSRVSLPRRPLSFFRSFLTSACQWVGVPRTVLYMKRRLVFFMLRSWSLVCYQDDRLTGRSLHTLRRSSLEDLLSFVKSAFCFQSIRQKHIQASLFLIHQTRTAGVLD